MAASSPLAQGSGDRQELKMCLGVGRQADAGTEVPGIRNASVGCGRLTWASKNKGMSNFMIVVPLSI
jgi:hypothetical protein